MQAVAADFDGDGWLDLLLINGSLDALRLEPSVLLRNIEGREFRETAYLPGFGSPANYVGGAVARMGRKGPPIILLASNPVLGTVAGNPSTFSSVLFRNRARTAAAK